MSKHVLLLGGHGKVSLLMTPLLVARAWRLTSVIRNADQESAIRAAGRAGPGAVDVLVESLEDVKSEGDARKILDRVRPDYVVWSAGAGGKGGPSRTLAIDRDSAIHFIRASIASPSVQKFLMVSALSERRAKAPWWDDAAWASVTHTNKEVLPTYYEAKLAADDVLTVLGRDRRRRDPGFGWICLRPGALLDGPPTGRISLGRTGVDGGVQRADVADVAVRLLENEGVSGWFDLLNGGKPVEEEVQRVLSEGVDSIQGESLEPMEKTVAATA